MIKAIRHIGLVVANLEKAQSFWCETMGFVVERRMEEAGPHIDAMMGLDGVKVTTIKLAAPDGNLIELLHFSSHPDEETWLGKPFSTGLTHIALTVENMDETYDRLLQAGVAFPAEPQMSPDGTARVIYATGPEGLLLELVEVVNK
jgi:catechol 2,3-dioxygenase-like lactoylglutathione lyase family enzyme